MHLRAKDPPIKPEKEQQKQSKKQDTNRRRAVLPRPQPQAGARGAGHVPKQHHGHAERLEAQEGL